jgi:PIN domain nuclease of toxin-antitoxin system
LDTHTFIWYVTDNPRLSAHVKLLIEDENNEKLVSIASIWEMAIKHSIGRLNFSLPFIEFVGQQLTVSNIGLREINLQHIEVVASLPLHHRDPFDRLIIAQSMAEQIPVLSRDAFFDACAIARVW